jgi:hypothetical protein
VLLGADFHLEPQKLFITDKARPETSKSCTEERSSKRGFSLHKLIVGGDENYSMNYVEEGNFGELIGRH